MCVHPVCVIVLVLERLSRGLMSVQASGSESLLHKARDCQRLVREQTETTDCSRGHCAEINLLLHNLKRSLQQAVKCSPTERVQPLSS